MIFLNFFSHFLREKEPLKFASTPDTRLISSQLPLLFQQSCAKLLLEKCAKESGLIWTKFREGHRAIVTELMNEFMEELLIRASWLASHRLVHLPEDQLETNFRIEIEDLQLAGRMLSEKRDTPKLVWTKYLDSENLIRLGKNKRGRW